MSRRITRSQTICLAERPVVAVSNIENRKSEPSKKSNQIITSTPNEPALKKTTAKTISVTKERRNTKCGKAKTLTPTIVKLGSAEISICATDKQKVPGPTRRTSVTVSKSLDFSTKASHKSNEIQEASTPTCSNVSQTSALRRSLRITLKEKSSPALLKSIDISTLNQDKQNLTVVGNYAKGVENTPQSTSTSDQYKRNVRSKTMEVEKTPKSASNSKQDRRGVIVVGNSAQRVAKTPQSLSASKQAKRNVTVVGNDANQVEKTPQSLSTPTLDKQNLTVVGNNAEEVEKTQQFTQPTSISKEKQKTLTPTPKRQLKRTEAATIFIAISDDLKKILLDDSHYINNRKNLYEIPRGLNVAEVVAKYLSNINADPNDPFQYIIRKALQGTIEYFNVLIGRQMLYESERVQYEVLLEKYPGIPMSQIYPPIYLLRLFVLLNKLLNFSNEDIETSQNLINHLNEFVKYLDDNKATIFNMNPSC